MSDTLSFELNKTAEWRARMQERYPEDSRNQTARILLARLVKQEASADFSRRYDELQDDETISIEQLSQAHSEILGGIGFQWEPKHIDEVLDRIVNRVTGKTAN